MVKEESGKKENKKAVKKGRRLRKFLTGLGIFVAIVSILIVWYTNHMHYDIEAHEYYE